MTADDRKFEDQAALAAKAQALKEKGETAPSHPPTDDHADEGLQPIPRKDHPVTGAFDAEGHKVVVERSRKVR